MKKIDLPIDRVIKNVRTEVVRLARTIGHEQVPAIYDEVVGDFYFIKTKKRNVQQSFML